MDAARRTSYRPAMPVKSPLYDRDFFAWSREQADLLRAGKLAEADIEHIAEEIDSMGRTEKRELISRLSVLLLHLLKWRYQPEKRGPSWEASIRVQRNRIADHLDDNPSLKPLAPTSARLRLSRRGAGGGRGDGAGGVDVSPSVPLDGGAGVGRRVLAGVSPLSRTGRGSRRRSPIPSPPRSWRSRA